MSRKTELLSAPVMRRAFSSQAAFAKFALSNDAPRYSVIACRRFLTERHATLKLRVGEALFSENMEALQRAALGWDDNKIQVALVATFVEPRDREPTTPTSVWIVRALPGFPDDLLDDVFAVPATSPRLDASVEEAERMALAQLSAHPEHPFMFLDRCDADDAVFLSDLADHAIVQAAPPFVRYERPISSLLPKGPSCAF